MEYLYHQVVLKETDRYNLIEIPIYTYINIHTKGLCSKIMFLLEYWVLSKTPFASQNTLCTFPARTVKFEQSFPRKTNCDLFYQLIILLLLPCASTNQNRSTSWWFQPIWKILVKMGIFPKWGVKIENIWNHHPVHFFLKKNWFLRFLHSSPTRLHLAALQRPLSWQAPVHQHK